MKRLYVGKTIGGNYVINSKPGTGLVGSGSSTYPTLNEFIDAIELQSRNRRVVVEIIHSSSPEEVIEISKGVRGSSARIDDILYKNASQLKKRKVS
ncbi:hypothetical protein HYT57_04885 [Candidatus Woesearchaeota archaeon]|nr:hypothetical protein [Candidatus Woesearchaeota archaeon]